MLAPGAWPWFEARATRSGQAAGLASGLASCVSDQSSAEQIG
jgi:hypothetical protein